jgi:DNA polymerase III subunit epsilon
VSKLIYPILNRTAHAKLKVHGQAMPCEELARALGIDSPGASSLLAKVLDGRFKLENDMIGLWSWELPFPPLGESIVALDIEATNGDPLREEIIEIGAIKISRDGNGEVKHEEFSVFNDPKRAISPYVQTLTGITPAMLIGAPPLEESLNKLLEFLGDATLVIQNAPFDLAFLRPRFAKLGCELDNTVVDTLDLARQALPGRRRRGLDALGQIYGVAIEHRHRALGDARATLHIAQALYFTLAAGSQTTLAALHQGILDQSNSGQSSPNQSGQSQALKPTDTTRKATQDETETPIKPTKRQRRSRKSRSLGPLEEVPA